MRGGEIAQQLIVKVKEGDHGANEDLIALLYDELRLLAKRYMRSQPVDHTLQTTALVNEAYLRLMRSDAEWQDRAHFLGAAARAMRTVLVDYAREALTAKRGKGWRRVPLESENVFCGEPATELLSLHEALNDLATEDRRSSRIVELRFFGGLTENETARVLGVSRATISREWSYAKAWLMGKMQTKWNRED